MFFKSNGDPDFVSSANPLPTSIPALEQAVFTDYQHETSVLLAGGSYVKDGFQRYGTLPLSDSGQEIKTLGGNALDSFIDGCAVLDTSKWDFSGVDASGAISVDGTVAGSDFYKMTSSALVAGVQNRIVSKVPFGIPAKLVFGVSLSQRIPQEEHYIEMVSCLSDGTPETTGVVDSPFNISSIRVLTNVAYITLANSPVGLLNPLDRVVISGCADSRLNVGAVAITTIWYNKNTVILPLTIADGTYTVGANAVLNRIAPTSEAVDYCGLLFDGTVSGNFIPITKNAGTSPLIGVATLGLTSMTDAIQASTQPYTSSFQPRGINELRVDPDSVTFATQATDASILPAITKRSQSVPNFKKQYVVRVRSRNLPNKSIPVANIVSVTKTGTTTATVVFDAPHNLTTADWVTAYGVTDSLNFPNLPVATAITSIVDPTTITLTWWTASTSASFGGTVCRVNGGALPAGQTQQMRGIARAVGYMMVACHSTPTGVLVGDTVRLVGVRDNVASLGVDNRYKVAHLNPNIWIGTTTNGSAAITGITDTTLLAVGALVSSGTAAIPAGSYIVSIQPGVGFTINQNCTADTTNNQFTLTGMMVEAAGGALQPTTGGTVILTAGLIGGAIIKETDFRINFVKVLDYNRMPVEAANNGDIGESFPTAILNTPAVTVTSGNLITTFLSNLLIADAASTAVTSTTTSGIIIPSGGTSYHVNIPVTAVSGTNPTMDNVIQESDDTGTNWFDVYHFPRITATGMYRSDPLPLTGNRIRYVQTIGGSSPSFSRAINRIQSQAPVGMNRCFYDRTLAPNTLNSATPLFLVGGCQALNITINMGAITTTAPAMVVEFSEDGSTGSYYQVGSDITPTANTPTFVQVTNVLGKYVRVRVKTAGTGATLNYINIKGK